MVNRGSIRYLEEFTTNDRYLYKEGRIVLSRVLIKEQAGRRPLTALAVLGLLGSLLLAGGNALAVHNEGLFELDTSNSAAICAPVTAPCGDANIADGAAGATTGPRSSVAAEAPLRAPSSQTR